jgi:hypothetical protein
LGTKPHFKKFMYLYGVNFFYHPYLNLSQLTYPIMSNFQKVKNYLLDLNYGITKEDEANELFVINAEEKGIVNMLVDCEDDILIIEQHILNLSAANVDTFKRLLQFNRSAVHGAYVLDETGSKVIFRDTLQLNSLDINELEASVNALSLSLVENHKEIIGFASAN